MSSQISKGARTRGPLLPPKGVYRRGTLSETEKEENEKMKRRKRKIKERKKKGEIIGIKLVFVFKNMCKGLFFLHNKEKLSAL